VRRRNGSVPVSNVVDDTTVQLDMPPPDTVGLADAPVDRWDSTATVTSAFAAGAMLAVV
jgi:hypothetical protein